MAGSGVIGGGLESIEDPYTLLQCRTVRIGSYKVVPRDKILISTEGIRLAVPALQDETETAILSIESAEIRRVLIHFGRLPVIFFYPYKSTAERLRNILKMTSKVGPYYDPDSRDETQRRISLLLHERISEESKLALKTIFGAPVELLVEITSKEANELLVRSSPKEVTEEVESLRKENVSLKNVRADREGRVRNGLKRARQKNMQSTETRNAHTDQRSQVQKRVAEQTKEEDSARLISLKSRYERRIARLEKENAELRADKRRESELANQMLTLLQRQLEKVTEEVESLRKENVSLKNVQADREGRVRNGLKRARQKNMQLTDTRNAHTDQRSQVQKRVAEQTKGGDLESIEDGSMKDPHTLLQCRTVRIGSYEVVPRDKILISTEGVRLAVPALQDETETAILSIESAEIRRVLIHFGRGIPVIFFSTYKNTAERLRNILKMTSKEGPYYDPDSQDETQRRITLLLRERISEESKLALKTIFGVPVDVLVEITSKEANELLVRSSPKEGGTAPA